MVCRLLLYAEYGKIQVLRKFEDFQKWWIKCAYLKNLKFFFNYILLIMTVGSLCQIFKHQIDFWGAFHFDFTYTYTICKYISILVLKCLSHNVFLTFALISILNLNITYRIFFLKNDFERNYLKHSENIIFGFFPSN